MGLFDRLFGGRDPSSAWVRDPELRLEIDLEAGTLAGVRLGLAPESLSRLGPPSSPHPSQDGVYVWAPLGLEAVATRGILTGYQASFDPDDLGPGGGPYPGILLRGALELRLGADSGLGEVTAALGDPWHRYADPEDEEASVSLFYERRGLEWEVEILASGTLGSIALRSPPTLARADIRKLLRVEKPWPP
jgi:hypothetical protein